MPDLFADDLFEIYGTHIQISSITDYRLGQIEYIKRPVYYERGQAKWRGLLGVSKHKIDFGGMEYYGAIIGETKYKNAIEEAKTVSIFDAIVKTAASGITDAISNLTKNKVTKSHTYRIMNSAGRVFERTFEEIPAVLFREDGKVSEVYKKDELYPLLGEPIAPTREMVPALFITSSDGNYVFFGNGIQLDNVQREYERLKLAISEIKRIREQKAGKKGFLNALGINLPAAPKINIPFLTPAPKPKALESSKEDNKQ